MASSGTVGVTTLDTAKLIEKCYRRCGIPTGGLTPELIDIANENLFLLFQNFSNRGINLWCIDYPLRGLRDHQGHYDLPVGTIDVMNANFRQITTMADTAATTTATSESYSINAGATTVNMVGFKVGTATTGYTIAASTDDATYTTMETATKTIAADTWYWVDIEPALSRAYWRFTFPTATAITSHSLCNTYTDLKMSLMNWDDYMNLPNKRVENSPSLQWAFDRLMTQQVVVWPVPNAQDTGCLALRTHRQIQDVGTMSQTIEVPDRWLDAVSWTLSTMCAVEVPTVPADRIQLCQQMATDAVANADREEVDAAPIYLQPRIGVYTR